MSCRTITAIALCLVTLVTGSLGLGSRKVLCMDGDGHYAIEAAGHAPHGGCHAEDADDDHHRAAGTGTQIAAGVDGSHDTACSDTTLANSSLQRQTNGSDASRFLQPTAELPAWTVPLARSSAPLALAARGAGRSTGTPLRAELASLRAIILRS